MCFLQKKFSMKSQNFYTIKIAFLAGEWFCNFFAQSI